MSKGKAGNEELLTGALIKKFHILTTIFSTKIL